MKKINTIIVDDEPLARDILAGYCEKISSVNLVAVCENAVEAYNLLQNTNVDLAFLDIQMPKLTGIDLIKNLSDPPKIIFTTAYTQYAVDGFSLEAVDYLLKPISFERFLKAFNRYCRISRNCGETYDNEEVKTNYNDAFIYVKSEKKMVKIFLKDIVYLESLRNNCKIATDDREVMSTASISELEERLPETKFMRIHRSFIIAVDKITAFSATHIEAGETELPIGRNYKDEVTKRLNV